MAHKVMVDGTVYDVTGGKTLIDGTQYSIKNGKTMADGTVYEVGFSSMPVITTSGNYSASSYVNYAYIQFTDATGANRKIDAQGYTYTMGADGGPVPINTFEVPAGTVITCYVESESYQVTAKIVVNGTTVASKSDGDKTYLYTVTGNASIEIISKKSGGYYVGTIRITEE